MTSLLDRVIRAGLIATIVFTALVHGAVRPWAVATFELMITSLVLLWAVKIFREKHAKVVIPGAALPIAVLVVIGLMQSVSFGRGFNLSMDLEATRSSVVVLFFLLASFIIASNFFTAREHLWSLAKFMVAYGALMATFALAQHFTWNGSFYWIGAAQSEFGQFAKPFGPFANRNHFSGYMELLLPIPIVLTTFGKARSDTRWLYGISAAIMGFAAIASLSRGGMISLAAALIFIALMGLWKCRLSSGGELNMMSIAIKAVAAIAAVITVSMFWMGSSLRDRLLQTRAQMSTADRNMELAGRKIIWQSTLSLIRANPITGVGLGAFGTVYPIYSCDDEETAVSRAHNDYLQILAETGIAGGLLVLWFIASLCRTAAAGLRSREPLLARLAIASTASIIAIMVHSFFDFNLQLPSNALLFLVVVALNTACASIEPITIKPRTDAGTALKSMKEILL
jgi:O-antigen ligase